ncbi:MAG: carboxypeptidase regulatory-like domain-containing protein [Planctomycetes bacterium]|nr:carboxypeptidase regulatory-like domain-containing protein [Planctomycetota bacterium]
MKPPSGSIRPRVLVLIVLLGLSAVALLLWPDASARTMARLWSGYSEGEAIARTSGAPSPKTVKEVPVVPPPTESQVRAAAAGADTGTMILRALDRADEPVAGLQLIVWSRLRVAVGTGQPGDTSVARLTTNQDGIALAFHTGQASELRIAGHLDGRALNEVVFEDQQLAAPFPAEHTILVDRLKPFEIRIVYDTGEWFSGRVGISAEGVNWTDWQELQGGKLRALVPTARVLRVTAIVDRPGYPRSASRSVSLLEIESGTPQELVIAKDLRPTGSISLDMSLHEPGVSFAYELLRHAQGGQVFSGLSDTPMPAGRLHRLKSIPAGDYTLVVRVGACAFLGLIDVVAGEDHVVLIGAIPAASATVKVCDSDGKPLPGAVLRLDAQWHTAFPAKHRQGVQAVADKEGAALLAGLPSTLASLQVDAEGFEPVSVPVALVGGVVANLGVISLVPARGCIRVHVTGLKAGQRVRVGCTGSGGSAGAVPSELPSSGTITFTGIPCRSYVVFVVPADGGKAISRVVNLGPDQPEVDVTLDATGLEDDAPATFR